MMNRNEIRETACNLFDGGWRAADMDEIAAEYDLTEQEAEAICEELADLENA